MSGDRQSALRSLTNIQNLLAELREKLLQHRVESVTQWPNPPQLPFVTPQTTLLEGMADLQTFSEHLNHRADFHENPVTSLQTLAEQELANPLGTELPGYRLKRSLPMFEQTLLTFDGMVRTDERNYLFSLTKLTEFCRTLVAREAELAQHFLNYRKLVEWFEEKEYWFQTGEMPEEDFELIRQAFEEQEGFCRAARRQEAVLDRMRWKLFRGVEEELDVEVQGRQGLITEFFAPLSTQELSR